MAETTLLLGGNGFIGLALARRLAARRQAVTILSRQRPAVVDWGITWQQGDLGDRALLAKLLPGCNAVVHLATTSTPGRNVKEPSREAEDNLVPLLRLLEMMSERGGPPLIYLSSGGAIYGDPSYLPVDEKHPLAPLSYHAAGKAAAEQFLGVFARQGHTATILRPANVYGPGQPLQAGFGVIRTLLEHLRRGTPMTIWGDAGTARDYLHIDDMVAACLAVLDAPVSGAYNLGTGAGIDLRALCQLAERITGRRLEIIRRPARGVDVRTIALESAAFRHIYGWRPEVSLESGIRATWEWLLNLP